MPSSVTRRTSVREVTTTTRKSGRLTKGGSIMDSNKLDAAKRSCSSSQIDSPSAIGKDYFESGSYRSDRIGEPWRSPNMSRRGIYKNYAGSNSMQITHKTSTYYDSSNDDKTSRKLQPNLSTPVNDHNLRSACKHGGGIGVICHHVNCLTCVEEKTTRGLTTHAMYDHWNLNSNNSAHQSSNQSSTNDGSSAVSRVSLWRTDNDVFNQENCSAYDKRTNRKESNKQVSSIFGLDEDSDARVTRSRVKRLGASNHINAAKGSASSSSSTTNRWSFLTIVRTFISFFSSIFYNILYKLRNCVLVCIQKTRETQQYYSVPFICAPFIQIGLFILNILLLPVRLFQSLSCFRKTSSSQVHSSSSQHGKVATSTGSRYALCSPCILWLISAVIAVIVLFLILSVNRQGDDRGAAFVEGLKEHKGLKWISIPFHMGWNGVLYLGQYFKSLGEGICCCFTSGTACLWQLVGFLNQTIISSKEYVISTIWRRRSPDLVVPAEWRTNGNLKENGDYSNDNRFIEILAALEEHDKILRKQEEVLNSQQEKVQKLMESLSNSELATSSIKAAMGKVEKDIHDIQVRTIKIDATVLELKQWREKMATPVDKNFVIEMTKKRDGATADELRSIRNLVRRLGIILEREGRNTKAKLRQQEEAMRNLTTYAQKVEAEGKKPLPPDPNIDRLAGEVTFGHQRLVTLQAKVEGIEKLVSALKRDQAKMELQQEWAQKEILEGSQKTASGTGCPSVSCGKRITAVEVRRLIDEALRIFAADRIARPDFALESGGGSIIGTRCTSTYTDRPAVFSIFGIPLFRLSRSPRSVIQPAMQPGECWAFRGTKGQLVVRLASDIVITAITIEHIPKSLSPNGRIDSAPHELELKGLESESDYEGWSLGQFVYREDGPPLQTFNVEPPKKNDQSNRSPPSTFRYVELMVLSNHGHPEYTCIYRLRVHGNFVAKKDETESKDTK